MQEQNEALTEQHVCEQHKQMFPVPLGANTCLHSVTFPRGLCCSHGWTSGQRVSETHLHVFRFAHSDRHTQTNPYSR